MMNVGVHPIAMIRVRLPGSSSFASCPSGDTDYEIAYDKALFESMPAGYRVVKQRINEKWPVDLNGMTWVPIECINRDDAVQNLTNMVVFLEGIIADMKTVMSRVK